MLIAVLASEQPQQVEQSHKRSQLFLAGLVSLTMLLCEQVNRIARLSAPVPEEDQEYLRLVLKLLA